MFKKYIEEVMHTNEDPAILNFMKSVLAEFKYHYSQAFQQSNLVDLVE
jgi:hypothetical protein